MGTEAEAGAPEGPQGRNRQRQHPQKSSQLVSLYRGKIDNASLPENIRLKRYWLKFPGFPGIDSRISQVERRKISTRKLSALSAYRRIFQIFKYILYTGKSLPFSRYSLKPMFSGNHFPPTTLDDGGGLYLERIVKFLPLFFPDLLNRIYLSGKEIFEDLEFISEFIIENKTKN